MSITVMLTASLAHLVDSLRLTQQPFKTADIKILLFTHPLGHVTRIGIIVRPVESEHSCIFTSAQQQQLYNTGKQ